MVTVTPTQQRRLLDLQRVDTALRRLQHRRANLPEQKALDEHTELLRRIERDAAEARERLDRLSRDQRRHEDEIATVETRRKTDEAQMLSGRITTERQLDALKSEIASLRGRKNDLEDALLEIMEQREEVESLVGALRERSAELRDATDPLTAARDAAAAGIDAELAQRRTERDDVAGDVPAVALALYDDLRARKGDVGVAELRGRSCTGCRLELTALEEEEVREEAATGLATCQQCGRILVPAD